MPAHDACDAPTAQQVCAVSCNATQYCPFIRMACFHQDVSDGQHDLKKKGTGIARVKSLPSSPHAAVLCYHFVPLSLGARDDGIAAGTLPRHARDAGAQRPLPLSPWLRVCRCGLPCGHGGQGQHRGDVVLHGRVCRLHLRARRGHCAARPRLVDNRVARVGE